MQMDSDMWMIDSTKKFSVWTWIEIGQHFQNLNFINAILLECVLSKYSCQFTVKNVIYSKEFNYIFEKKLVKKKKFS